MTRRQCVTFAAVIALCLGIYTSSFALPANPITACPFAITAGGTYTLTADLTASGDCITIAQPLGQSVTVALNGFSITGDGSGAAIVAAPDTTTISVVGPGTISSFFTAVDLFFTTDVTVKRLTVNDAFLGIVFGQGSLYDSVIEGTGFCLEGVEAGAKSLVKNVTATGCAFGIAVGDGSSVQQSTANSNGLGIAGEEKVLVKNSQASDNALTGIFVGPNGSVSQSVTSRNGGAGFSNETKAGIAAGPGSNVNSNTANENVIGIAMPVCPGTIQQNTARDNRVADIVAGTGCTVKKNITTTP
jgi:hypothetical protein